MYVCLCVLKSRNQLTSSLSWETVCSKLIFLKKVPGGFGFCPSEQLRRTFRGKTTLFWSQTFWNNKGCSCVICKKYLNIFYLITPSANHHPKRIVWCKTNLKTGCVNISFSLQKVSTAQMFDTDLLSFATSRVVTLAIEMIDSWKKTCKIQKNFNFPCIRSPTAATKANNKTFKSKR